MTRSRPFAYSARLESLEDRLTPSSLPLASVDLLPTLLDAGTQSGPMEVAAVRFRSFRNTSGAEVFLGVPDLGIPDNRVETDYS